MGTMNDCENTIPETGKRCGSAVEGPFHIRFCSEECADRTNRMELQELGITPEMMKEALEGYYECKDMIEQRERDGTRQISGDSESHNPYQFDQSEPDRA